MTVPTPTPAAPPADPAPTPTPPPAAPAATPAAAPADPAAELAAAKADTERWKHMSRTNEDRWKDTGAKLTAQEAILKQLAEKAGVTIDGTPDPAKLAEQLTAAQTQRTQAATELAVFRAAATAGGNADLLLDSRTFMAQAAQLDTSAADYVDQVKALVGQHVTANPALAAGAGQQPPAAPPNPSAVPSSNFSGAPAGVRQWTQQDVERATPAELTKAISDGLLAGMGVGRSKNRR